MENGSSGGGEAYIVKEELFDSEEMCDQEKEDRRSFGEWGAYSVKSEEEEGGEEDVEHDRLDSEEQEDGNEEEDTEQEDGNEEEDTGEGEGEDDDEKEVVKAREQKIDSKVEGFIKCRHALRRKCLKRRKSDKISTLPDSSLLRILTFLPIKESIRTGVLSKRWEFVWTTMSTLVFQNQCFIEDDIRRFVTGVDKTLLLCRNSNIEKFAVRFRYKDCFASYLNIWIRFARQTNVEELDLHLTFSRVCRYTFNLPQHVYSNYSLKTISLSNCKLVPTGVIKWKFLRSLSLEYLELSEDVMRKIFSGSPVLELLKLKAFHGIAYLAISSTSLKELIVDHCSGESIVESLMEISAPYLQSLHLLGPACGRKIRLTNTKSIVKATLDFSCDTCYLDLIRDYSKQCNLLRDLIESLQHVTELKLGTWCIQALSILKVKALSTLSRNWKCLTIDTMIKHWDVPGITTLLLDSPHLETLVINIKPVISHKPFVFAEKFLDVYKFDEENYWALENKYPRHSLQHLKTIKIVGFMDRSCSRLLALVKFLLQSARKLEKLIISSRRVPNNRCTACCVPGDFVEVTKQLLSFPRSSPHAMITFSESDLVDRV